MKSVILTLIAGTSVVGSPEFAVPLSLLEAAAVSSGPVAMPVSARPYADGTYTGIMADSVWGPVQVQVVIKDGRITSLKALRYPNDRRESLFISQLSLPRLRDEVVKAQSAKVDVVSGATVTSQAFVQSLEAALLKARGG